MFCGILYFILFCHQAESELQRATMDATRTTRQLEETIDDFEKQKIRDIKVCCVELFVQLDLKITISVVGKYMSVEAVEDWEVKPDSNDLKVLFDIFPHLLILLQLFETILAFVISEPFFKATRMLWFI